jgi:hypothetical protein
LVKNDENIQKLLVNLFKDKNVCFHCILTYFTFEEVEKMVQRQHLQLGQKQHSKKSVILNQRGFRGLKKGFVHEAKLKNSFVHSTKPEKGFDF